METTSCRSSSSLLTVKVAYRWRRSFTWGFRSTGSVVEFAAVSTYYIECARLYELRAYLCFCVELFFACALCMCVFLFVSASVSVSVCAHARVNGVDLRVPLRTLSNRWLILGYDLDTVGQKQPIGAWNLERAQGGCFNMLKHLKQPASLQPETNNGGVKTVGKAMIQSTIVSTTSFGFCCGPMIKSWLESPNDSRYASPHRLGFVLRELSAWAPAHFLAQHRFGCRVLERLLARFSALGLNWVVLKINPNPYAPGGGFPRSGVPH